MIHICIQCTCTSVRPIKLLLSFLQYGDKINIKSWKVDIIVCFADFLIVAEQKVYFLLIDL